MDLKLRVLTNILDILSFRTYVYLINLFLCMKKGIGMELVHDNGSIDIKYDHFHACSVFQPPADMRQAALTS